MKIKSLKYSHWGLFSDKVTELSEMSITLDSQTLEKGTKSIQLLSRVGSMQSRAYIEQLSQYTAKAPEKAVTIAFPSKHPSCHFPFFLACLLSLNPLPAPHQTYNSTLNHSLWPSFSPYGIFGGWWALAIFHHLDLLRFPRPLPQEL